MKRRPSVLSRGNAEFFVRSQPPHDVCNYSHRKEIRKLLEFRHEASGTGHTVRPPVRHAVADKCDLVKEIKGSP